MSIASAGATTVARRRAVVGYIARLMIIASCYVTALSWRRQHMRLAEQSPYAAIYDIPRPAV